MLRVRCGRAQFRRQCKHLGAVWHERRLTHSGSWLQLVFPQPFVVGRASDKVALDCGGKRSATPLSLPVKSAWFNPLRHFNPKRRRASLAAAVHTCGARYLVGDFVTGRVVVGKSSAIETAKAPPAGLAGLTGGDVYGTGQGASRGRADTRQGASRLTHRRLRVLGTTRNDGRGPPSAVLLRRMGPLSASCGQGRPRALTSLREGCWIGAK